MKANYTSETSTQGNGFRFWTEMGLCILVALIAMNFTQRPPDKEPAEANMVEVETALIKLEHNVLHTKYDPQIYAAVEDILAFYEILLLGYQKNDLADRNEIRRLLVRIEIMRFQFDHHFSEQLHR
ncbi:MAG: hypothetical protein AAFY71_12680 [Bacteroidota bacterium]